MYTGPKLTNEDLVFGYDTGYGLDQHSSTRHYKGEPATNLITAGLPGYFGSGGETLYRSNYYGLNSDSGVFQRNFVNNPNAGNNAGIYKNFTTSTLSSNTEFIQVSFDFYMIAPYVRSGQASTGLNGYLRVQSTNGTFDNYGWDSRYSNGSGDDWNNNSAYIGQWQKVSLFVDVRDDTTPSAITAMYIYVDFATQGEGIYTNFIITEHTTLPTGPVLYTSGTRSDTASLIDLVKTTDIDVSNVSFDSTGQPAFDGTDDKGVITNFPHIWNSSLSVESVVSWDDDTRSVILGNFDQGAGGHDINFEKNPSGTLRFYWDRGSRNVYSSANAVTTAGAYHHVVFVRDVSANNFRFYVDGELVTTVTNAGSNIPTTGSTFRFGADTRNGATVHNGSIPVIKAYSRVLTAAEITSNYNAYKNRFNI